MLCHLSVNDPDVLYAVGSITCPFTSILILSLVLRVLSCPVSSYVIYTNLLNLCKSTSFCSWQAKRRYIYAYAN